jgi:DNA-binding transcriptional MocR family regulator
MGYKYEAAADRIKRDIYSGRYRPGEKLPSIQKLSGELGYNADTIVKAYRKLMEEHVVYAVSKSGYYAMKSEDRAATDKNIVDMANIRPPDAINPYRDFCHCMEQAVSIYGKRLFEYAPPQGMPELTHALSKHLMNFQVFTKPGNIFVTNGAQQALYILGAMPFPAGGSKVLVEQPTYSVMLDILKNLRTPVVGIRRTKAGIDLNELEDIFKRGDIKFFYTMPRYQNPTGFCYDTAQKKEIVRLALKYGVYIAEDDYLADLDPDKKADPMYAMGNGERNIYIRSFSKTLLPGLRLGAAILPGELQKGFSDFKYGIDLNTSVLAQGALEVYLKSSMYRFHIKRTRKFYMDKMDVLKNACSPEQSGKTAWHVPETGLYAYLETGEQSSRLLEKGLLNSKVLVSSTESCYMEGFPHPGGIRLCVCKADDGEIKRAVDIIKSRIQA